MPKDPKRVKAGKRSKRKGGTGERDVVNLAKSLGLEAKRTWETAANQDPRLRKTDVLIEDMRVQVKFKKGGFGALYRALDGVDVAFVRQNNEKWLAVMPAKDYLWLFSRLSRHLLKGIVGRKPISVPLKPRKFGERGRHFLKVTRPVDWPRDEPDVD